MRGAHFSCGQHGHREVEFPSKTSLGPSRGVARSKPTMGDKGKNHQVFVVVDDCLGDDMDDYWRVTSEHSVVRFSHHRPKTLGTPTFFVQVLAIFAVVVSLCLP